MNNLVIRAITGIVFVTLILGSVWWSDTAAIWVFSVFMCLGVIEFYRLFQKHSAIQLRWELSFILSLIFYGIILLVTYKFIPLFVLSTLIPLVFLILLIELWRKKKHPLINAAVNLFGIVYIVVPFSCIVIITYIEDFEFPLLAGMFLLIWSNDTFAYLSGLLFGKNKLFERVSPKKTWEGTIGGIMFTVGVGALIDLFVDPREANFWLYSAFLIAPCAIFGDLLESLFKRSLKIKDSGNLLPGHGGVLDRFDAMLFVVPFFLVWILIYNLL